MTLARALGLFLVLATFAGPAQARPADRLLNSIHVGPAEAPRGDHPAPGRGVFSAASQETVYFGGTFWNPDSSRWEALRDSVWTFDTGVGSSFNHDLPWVDPYKDSSLHATMEGWTGFDRTFSNFTYFRRTTDCPVGAGFSMHCGVTQTEALLLDYAAGAGYGNNWHVCIGHPFDFSGSPVTMTFDYRNESEDGFDFSRVIVDTVGDADPVHDVIAVEYTGNLVGHESLALQPGETLPAGPRNGIIVKFCFDSDNAWSDEDGQNPTVCGAFSVDNVALSGGIDYPLQGFETNDGGWVLQPARPGAGGDWSDIVSLADLPATLAPCGCDLQDSVLVFSTLQGGHGRYQDNLAVSPWIDLRGAGVAGSGGKFVETHVYSDLPVLNYVFGLEYIQYAPFDPDGLWRPSQWISNGFVDDFGGKPTCTNPNQAPARVDFSPFVDPAAEEVRVALGVISFCRFFANCTGITNSTPWFDRVRFGVYGQPGGPILTAYSHDLPQDAFPENGTLNVHATGRVDCATVKGATSPESGTSLGDTLIVRGRGDGLEVRVQFAIRPGPGINTTALQQFLSRVHFEETRRGRDWYEARMDTAEIGASGGIPGVWMTTFHEEDPAFTGSDTDLDMTDYDPHGLYTRLKNDIFPDNLLTPGSRLELFYKGNFQGSSVVTTFPDTTGGNYLEMECLPSSMALDGSHNAVLYVDHDDPRGAQTYIERALAMFLPGGSANAENTAWDRWDVRASGGEESFFGRPLNTEYGATLTQALGYHTILWNTGDLSHYNLRKEDGDVLIPWLTLTQFGEHSLYLSGDGLVQSVWDEQAAEPSAKRLLNEQCGVSLDCGTFREVDCPAGTPLDETPCPLLDPVEGSRVSSIREEIGSPHLAQGNGCPERRSFDVMIPTPQPAYGSPLPDEEYVGDAKVAQYASISNEGGPPYALARTLVDGVSLDERRDPVDCNAVPASPLPLAVLGRLTEVLLWFRTPGGIGIEPPVTPPFITSLAAASPNPLRGGAEAHIRFSLAKSERVELAVYDLRGARVRVLLDGPGAQGWNEAVWDGADSSGRPVADGVYFYRLTAEERTFSKKLVVLGR